MGPNDSERSKTATSGTLNQLVVGSSPTRLTQGNRDDGHRGEGANVVPLSCSWIRPNRSGLPIDYVRAVLFHCGRDRDIQHGATGWRGGPLPVALRTFLLTHSAARVVCTIEILPAPPVRCSGVLPQPSHARTPVPRRASHPRGIARSGSCPYSLVRGQRRNPGVAPGRKDGSG
jgi:hypothetical protein